MSRGFAGEAHEARAVVVRRRELLARGAGERVIMILILIMIMSLILIMILLGRVNQQILKFVGASGDVAGADEGARFG